MTIYAIEINSLDPRLKTVKSIYDVLDMYSISNAEWDSYDDMKQFEKAIIEKEDDLDYAIIDTKEQKFYFRSATIGIKYEPIKSNETPKKKAVAKKVK
jgi:hypothetical protein